MSVSLMSVVAAAVEGLESSGKNREYIEAAIFGLEYGVIQKNKHSFYLDEQPLECHAAENEAAEREFTI